MNIKQYFAHLGYWVRTFPRWSDNEHTTTGIAGSGEYYCLLCDFVEIEKPNKDIQREATPRREIKKPQGFAWKTQAIVD